MVELPEGAVYSHEVKVVAYMQEDGSLGYSVFTGGDMPLSSYIGLVELAKIDIVQRFRESGE